MNLKKKKFQTICISCLVLIISTATFAIGPLDPPGRPGKPKIKNFGKDFCELEWSVPAHDGGAPITNYLVEKSLRYSPFWRKAIETKDVRLEYKITELNEGSTYMFRVLAKNKVGYSEPSENSALVIINDN